ncbi:MAG: M42 family peptidase [Candidatus Syntrophonatronum acetioxidans]|uniref:M42 family peptidase n=1 Tax=Candidatus Syntrophonatronum acetioxidans TaxID=1795816 RepID=A0A424YHL1_9FIRM|nr:MAG: M42 family peptidase [Candidatus Syntrophonatronum acetioxidans]
MSIKDFLKLISTSPGVSGHEEVVARIIADEFSRYVHEIRQDSLGNVLALKRGQGEDGAEPVKIMVAAHMDEIGLMVSKIEKGGFLRISPLGGIDPRSLLNQEVVVHGDKESLPGVIGAKSPHILEPEEIEKGVKIDKLFIDVGFSEEEVKKRVAVGDPVTISRDFIELSGSHVAGKALDDRAGVALLLKYLQELQYLNHRADVYAVATVQEEVGVRGAVVSAYGTAPHLGIAVDVTHGNMPGVAEYKTSELEKGAVITTGPNIHPLIYKKLVEIAREYNIPYQEDITPGATGTDARAFQVSREGVATGLISIPLRYMHTSVELLSLKDIHASAQLMARFTASLNRDFCEELITCY